MSFLSSTIKKSKLKDRKKAVHYTGYSSEDSINKEDISFEDKKSGLVSSPKIKLVK